MPDTNPTPDTNASVSNKDSSPAKPQTDIPAKPAKSTSKVVWILLGGVILMLLCCTTGALLIRGRRLEWIEDWREGLGINDIENTETTDDNTDEVVEESEVTESHETDNPWFDGTIEDIDEDVEDTQDDILDEEEIDLPVAPSELRFAEFMPVGSVTLIWNDNSHNEDGFRIQRMGGPTRVTGPNITQVIYNSEPECGETYHYRVYGYNDHGRSDYSNVVSLEGRCP